MNDTQHPIMGSARLGAPPNTAEDADMVRYMVAQLNPLPKNLIDTSQGLPFMLAMFPDTGQDPKENIVAWIILITALFIILTLASTSLRIYLRLRMNGMYWSALTSDDWAIIPTAFTSLFIDGLQLLAVAESHIGYHQFTMTYHHMKISTGIWYSVFALFFLWSGLSKVAILLFLRRLGAGFFPIFRNLVTFLIGVCVVWGIVATGICVSLCGNPRNLFDPIWSARQNEPLRCLNVQEVNRVLNLIHMALDFTVTACMVFVYVKLKTSWGRKFSLIALLAVALGSCTFSVLRAAMLGNEVKDPAYNMANLALWANLEMVCTCLTANLPVIYWFFYERTVIAEEDRQMEARYETDSNRESWFSEPPLKSDK